MNPTLISTRTCVRGFTRRLAQRGSALFATGLLLAATAPASFAGSADRDAAEAYQPLAPRSAFHAAISRKQQQAANDRAELEAFLGRSQKALKTAGIEFSQVQQAVAALDDEQAARLAARARQANADFAAGAFSNEMLTYIVIALATAVLVLVLVL
jgi:hypothetical protein